MVMEGDLVIDDHHNSPEYHEALESVMKQVGVFREAAAKVDERDFEAARELIEDSELPETTQNRLTSALDTGEWEVIDSVFSSFKERLGSALCEGGCEGG